MSLELRFEKFIKLFPQSGVDFAAWKKLKTWSDVNPFISKLDLSIFPDCLEALDWEVGALRTVVVPTTLTKLKELNFVGNHIDKLVIPMEITTLRKLDLSSNPLAKFNLGGSSASLKELILPDDMPNPRVKIPSGMVKLDTLRVGSIAGTVLLPKDAVNLTELDVTITSPADRLKLPAELVNLQRLIVEGDIEHIAIPTKLEKLYSLHVRTNGTTLTLPRSLPDLRELVINAHNVKSLTIPTSLAVGLVRLSVNAYQVTEFVLPKLADKLEDLSFHTPDANVKIPAKLNALVQLTSECNGLELAAKVDTLNNIRITAQSADIKSSVNLDGLVKGLFFVKNELKLKLPQELPQLKILSVPDSSFVDGKSYEDLAVVTNMF